LPHGVNAYLWLPPEGGGPLLFDCGWPWSGRALADGLRDLNVMPEELGAVIITHDDVDHTGRLASLQAVSRARVFAHEAEIPRLSATHWRSVPGNSGPLDWVNLAARVIYGRWPHQPLYNISSIADGSRLPGGWQAHHTPGHTPGHTSYFHPGLGVLIAGDAIGPAPHGRLRAPQPSYAEDRAAVRTSIADLAALEPEIICCGHGPIIRNGAAMLRELAWQLRSE
jgi:glyoxylase-like metal-dependent hydrolase (beta-lactamase superfamily II)